MFAKAQCYLLDIMVQPLMRILESKIIANEELERQLREKKQQLQRELDDITTGTDV